MEECLDAQEQSKVSLMNRSSRGVKRGPFTLECCPVNMHVTILLTFKRWVQVGGRTAPHVLASSCVGSSSTVQPPPADHPEGQEPMGAQEAEPGGPSQAEPGQGPGLTGRPALRPLQAAQPASPQLLNWGRMRTYICPPQLPPPPPCSFPDCVSASGLDTSEGAGVLLVLLQRYYNV